LWLERTSPEVQHGLTAPSSPEKAQFYRQRGLNSRRNHHQGRPREGKGKCFRKTPQRAGCPRFGLLESAALIGRYTPPKAKYNGGRPIAHKYRKGKMQRTLKRESKELEVVDREAIEIPSTGCRHPKEASKTFYSSFASREEALKGYEGGSPRLRDKPCSLFFSFPYLAFPLLPVRPSRSERGGGFQLPLFLSGLDRAPKKWDRGVPR